MYRLEYNPIQDAYHVSEVKDPKNDEWTIVLDNSTRDEIDEEYNRRIKAKKYAKNSDTVNRLFDSAIKDFYSKQDHEEIRTND